MMEYKVKTYKEAIDVIEEVGLLPLATLFPDYPSLNTITLSENWYSDTENDPWIWRTKFSSDGVASYGKFIKKKSVLVSRQLLPYVKSTLGHTESVEERYFNGHFSKEAFDLYNLIRQEEGIDTRALRLKAGLKESHKKRIFENALLELQGQMDIVISGIQEKKNIDGEKNGWNSTAFETYESWADRNNIETFDQDREEAKKILMLHFSSFCGKEVVKKIERIFK
ncbi:AlkZ-related protein [Robertmurraya sp. Marseille-Q9965]